MRIFIFVILCAGLSFGVYGQSPVRLTSKYNSDRSESIFAEKNGFGTYTVRIQFTKMDNTSGARDVVEIVSSNRLLITQRPIEKDRYVDTHFTYSYIRGNVKSTPDTAFVYRLPFSTRVAAKAYDMYNVNERYFGEEGLESWRPIQFVLTKGDTVFAARKGLVVEIVDGKEPLDVQGTVSYKTESNYLIVEHADGTMAKYNVLEKNSFMVKEGQTVYPDTPLALAGTYDSNQYQLRFQVTAIRDNREASKKDGGKKWILHLYIDPVFATTEGNRKLTATEAYTPVVTEELITAEMTKKEKQRRK